MTFPIDPLVGSAFAMGLFGGVHCVAMCGGVVGVLCSARPNCRNPRSPSYWLAYNGGRLVSYTVLGAAFATFSLLTTDALGLDVVRWALRAIAAIAMLAVGLHLLGLPSMVTAVESLGAPLWRRVAPFGRRLEGIEGAFLLGGLWGLMPCGLLYGALALAASAESPLHGAEVMAAFGLGTLPVMVTMSALAQTVARWIARAWVRRAAGILVLSFGLFSTAGVARQVGLGAPFGLTAPGHRCCPTR
jgi:sulfite exporter TauE/SafE